MSTVAYLSLADAARMIRDAVKDRSYRATPLGLEVARYYAIAPQTRTAGAYRCGFFVLMRADDKPFLERMRAELGAPGAIRPARKKPEGNRKPSVLWHITDNRGVLWLTEILDVYPLWSKKARDYAVWREAAILMAAGGWRSDEMERYFHEIRAAREYREPPEVAEALEQAEVPV